MKRFVAVLAVAALALLGFQAPAVAAPAGLLRAPLSDAGLAPLTPPDIRAGKLTELKGEGRAETLKGNPAPRKVVNRAKSLMTCPCYFYNKGSQDTSGFGTLPTGIRANWGWGASAPSFNGTNDAHTLFQLAASKEINGQWNHVEAGARDDGSGLEIFVYHWVDGVAQGYNTGFTVYGTPAFAPGTSVSPASGALHFAIMYSGGNWWVAIYPVGAAVEWVGYFPGTNWTSAGVNTFTDTTYPQAFTEIASYESNWADVCSSMGSDTLATSVAGSSWGSVAYPNLSTSVVNMAWGEAPAGIHSLWNAEGLSARTARLGGPGKAGC